MKGGKYTKKGEIDTDRNTENPKSEAKYQTEKTAGNTAYNSTKNVGRLIYEYVDREKSCVFFMLTT
jgi:hypothetical protein